MGVPAADIDKAQVELVLHQKANALRRQFEALGGDGVAVGGHHLAGDGVVDFALNLETLRHGRRQVLALIHGLDQGCVAVIHPGLAGEVERDVGDRCSAPEGERQLVGEGDRG